MKSSVKKRKAQKAKRGERRRSSVPVVSPEIYGDNRSAFETYESPERERGILQECAGLESGKSHTPKDPERAPEPPPVQKPLAEPEPVRQPEIDPPAHEASPEIETAPVPLPMKESQEGDHER